MTLIEKRLVVKNNSRKSVLIFRDTCTCVHLTLALRHTCNLSSSVNISGFKS